VRTRHKAQGTRHKKGSRIKIEEERKGTRKAQGKREKKESKKRYKLA
jgi:hypothetical protein